MFPILKKRVLNLAHAGCARPPAPLPVREDTEKGSANHLAHPWLAVFRCGIQRCKSFPPFLLEATATCHLHLRGPTPSSSASTDGVAQPRSHLPRITPTSNASKHTPLVQTVLFLEALRGVSLACSLQLIPLLANDPTTPFNVIAVSLPGFGWSEAPSKKGFGLPQAAVALSPPSPTPSSRNVFVVHDAGRWFLRFLCFKMLQHACFEILQHGLSCLGVAIRPFCMSRADPHEAVCPFVLNACPERHVVRLFLLGSC